MAARKFRRATEAVSALRKGRGGVTRRVQTQLTEERKVFRLESEWHGIPRLLVGINAKNGFLILANEDDVAAQSVVLSPYEVRWLTEQWRPSATIPAWRFWLANLRWRLRAAVSAGSPETRETE